MAAKYFEPSQCLGAVFEVGPSLARVNLLNGQGQHAQKRLEIGSGEVGRFVIIQSENDGILGRLTHVKFPERERLKVEDRAEENGTYPYGDIQLLATFDLKSGSFMGGISNYPRMGSKVFWAHPDLLKFIIESNSANDDSSTVMLDLAKFLVLETKVQVSPERLFGRHLAVLGTTGSGKSWTISKLTEEIARFNSRVILLDATGEFDTLSDANTYHVHFGDDIDAKSKEIVIPYHELTESDLFILFNPNGPSQAPKLRMAMKSLKLVKLAPHLSSGGVILKANNLKGAFDDAYRDFVRIVDGNKADFGIEKLAKQIEEECVFSQGGTRLATDPERWGGYNELERSYCMPLVTRIEDMIQSKALSCIFKPYGKASLFEVLDEFFKQNEKKILHVSLKCVPFSHHAREIIANALGRHLLEKARDNVFRTRPVLVLVDEAHQFLNKHLGDDTNRYPLDSFELIAKEGRKYWLNICLATQRPRDIPEAVLSQMGTFLVHRLIHDKDREIVESASGDIDSSAIEFLPTLAPGQAILIGVDIPIPMTLQIGKPSHPPISKGPDFQNFWKAA